MYYKKLNEEINDKQELWVDITTGEVVVFDIPKIKNSIRFITKTDLSRISSQQDLLDHFKNTSDKKFSNNFQDSLGGKFVNEARDTLHGQKVKVFDAICDQLAIRNLVFTSATELSELTGLKSQVIYRAVKFLADNHYLRVIRKNSGGRGNYLLEVHPVWCWIGDTSTREDRFKTWYQ